MVRFEWVENDKGCSLKQIELKLRDGGQINDDGLKGLGKELKKHLLLNSITVDLEKAEDLTDGAVKRFCQEIKRLSLRQLYLSLPRQAKVTNKGRYMIIECLKDISTLEFFGLRDENGIPIFLTRNQMVEEGSFSMTEADEEKKNNSIILKGIYVLFCCIIFYIFSQYLL